MYDNRVRQDQNEAGRRMASEERSTFKRHPKKASSKPTGHEAYLKALQESGANLVIMTTGGELHTGKIKHTDKFTISLECDASTVNGDGDARATFVFFKSAIEYFRPLTPPPAQGNTEAAA